VSKFLAPFYPFDAERLATGDALRDLVHNYPPPMPCGAQHNADPLSWERVRCELILSYYRRDRIQNLEPFRWTAKQ
jgi:hypothetical protein